MKIDVLTPWDQVCGNAEFAKRLYSGISSYATVEPVELQNLDKHPTLKKASQIGEHFREIAIAINSSESDLVHIQHEFCFFGRTIEESNYFFHALVSEIKKPIVVSLHTWNKNLWSPSPSTSESHHLALRRAKSINKINHITFRPIPAFFVPRPTTLKTKKEVDPKHNLLRKALGLSKSIVLHADHTAEQLLKIWPRLAAKAVTIPFPVEKHAVNHASSKWRKPCGTKWIVLPGFITPYKGHLDAIKALSLLHKNYTLVFAGDIHPKNHNPYPYIKSLLAAIDELKLSNRVLFTGYISDAEQQSLLFRQADVFILPYSEVGQSASAVLADVLAYNKPVVTSKSHPMYAYRKKFDCIYSSRAVDVSSPKIFAEAISTPDTWAEESHRENVIDSHSLDKISRHYIDVYRSSLAQH